MIETNAIDTGNGGNITIDADFVIAQKNSNISATAISGNGGNINVNAMDWFISPDSQIDTSSQLGVDGNIKVKTLDISDRNSLFKLPTTTIQTERKIIQSCGNQNNNQGVFSYTGKGGLPSNLLNDHHLSDRNLIADFELPNSLTTSQELKTDSLELLDPFIVEAAAWKINQQGKIELVAQASQRATFKPFSTSDCLKK